ncbi:MAG: murein biosynthesis integral membrane protein MurJ [Gemmatimonadaceae bacterium]
MSFALQVVIAAKLGASVDADAYFVVVGFVFFLSEMLIGVVTFAMLPAIVRTRVTKGDAAAFDVALLLNAIGALLVAAAAMIISLAAPHLGGILAPGSQTTSRIVDELLPIASAGFALYSAALLLGVLLQSRERFWSTALAPMLPYLGSILSVLYAPRDSAPFWLVSGFAVGAAISLALQVVCVIALGIAPRLAPRLLHTAAQDLRAMTPGLLPVAIAFACSLMLPVILRMWATTMGTGSAAALGYAMQFLSVPLALVVMPLATVLLPRLAELTHRATPHSFNQLFTDSMTVVTLGAALTAALMIGLADPLVTLLLQRGAFTAQDAHSTATTLQALAVGLVGMSVSNIAMRTLCATGELRAPAVTWVITLVVFVLSVPLFMPLGVAGLGAAQTAAYLVNATIYFAVLTRKIPGLKRARAVPIVVRILVAGVAAAAASHATFRILGQPPNAGGSSTAVTASLLLLSALSGTAVLALVIRLLRGHEVGLLVQFLFRRDLGVGAARVEAAGLRSQ